MNQRTNKNYVGSVWAPDDVDMIEYVERNPIMYESDMRVNRSERITATEKLWAQYSKRTGRSVKDLIKRWKSIYDTYKRFKKNPYKVKTKAGLCSKYLDGRLSFLGAINLLNVSKSDEGMSLVGESSKSIAPVIILSDEDMEEEKEETAKTVFNKDMLLKTTIVTQDMIEQLLQLKKKEETNVNVLGEQTYIGSDDEIKEETTGTVFETEMETLQTSSDLVTNDDIMVSSVSETIVPDIHSENFSLKVEEDEITNEQDNSTVASNETYVTEQIDKDISYQHRISTIDCFMEIGSYVTDHFSEAKQRELRRMLWTLIQEELKLLHK